MRPAIHGVLETVLYAGDLDAAERFYGDLLGLAVHARVPGRHVFFRIGPQMLLIFDPDVTQIAAPPDARLPVPAHGARGPGHVCFAASAVEIETWHAHLIAAGIAIEADFEWPGGGRSIYFRDPAGNSLEFAEPAIWRLS